MPETLARLAVGQTADMGPQEVKYLSTGRMILRQNIQQFGFCHKRPPVRTRPVEYRLHIHALHPAVHVETFFLDKHAPGKLQDLLGRIVIIPAFAVAFPI